MPSSSFSYAAARRALRRIRSSAERSEGGSELFREELRLLPGREVPALVDLVEVRDVRVCLLGPASRRPPDLAGERGEAERQRHRWRRLAGSLGLGLSSLPVRSGRGGAGARQPVQHDVVENVVTGEVACRLLMDERFGDL